MSESSVNMEVLGMASEIAASYLSNSHNAHVDQSQIPAVIETIFKTLKDLANGTESSQSQAAAEPQRPAIAVKKSVTPEHIVCLEDGKKLKMLKRHLKTQYDMSPDEYRAKWNLPPDYPMVAPNYAKQRSQLAKDIGLGTKRTAA